MHPPLLLYSEFIESVFHSRYSVVFIESKLNISVRVGVPYDKGRKFRVFYEFSTELFVDIFNGIAEANSHKFIIYREYC